MFLLFDNAKILKKAETTKDNPDFFPIINTF